MITKAIENKVYLPPAGRSTSAAGIPRGTGGGSSNRSVVSGTTRGFDGPDCGTTPRMTGYTESMSGRP